MDNAVSIFRPGFRSMILFSAVTACVLTLSACSSYEAYDYTPPSEIREGPGLFSGKPGKFVIVGPSGSEAVETRPATGR